jgi:hypothetical protein
MITLCTNLIACSDVLVFRVIASHQSFDKLSVVHGYIPTVLTLPGFSKGPSRAANLLNDEEVLLVRHRFFKGEPEKGALKPSSM